MLSFTDCVYTHCRTPRTHKFHQNSSIHPTTISQINQINHNESKIIMTVQAIIKGLKKKKTLEEISPILTQEVVCSVIYVLY